MSPSSYSTLFSTALLVVSLTGAAAHGTITGVTGANGVQAAGFGIIANTPRNGALPVPFEQDTSVIRDREINSGKTGVCGSTKAGGNNDVTAQLAAASNAGLPTASSSGQLTMTLHQVNQDGAGPYKCDVSTDGGNTFQPATVSTNVPGALGLSLAAATDFPLVMQVAAGTTCAGGPNGDACIARCRNPAIAGPFGSCVAFSMGGAANSTASGAAAAAATDSAAAATAADSTAAANAAAATTATGAAGAAGAQGAAGATGAAAGAKGAAAGAKGAAAGAKGAASGTQGAAAGTNGAAAGAQGATGAQGAAGANGAAGKSGGLLSKILGGGKRDEAPVKKRVIKSRVAGANSGYWLDA